MSLFYPFKSTYQSLLPYILSQYFSPFGINLQKGSLHQEEQMMVDKWGQEVGKSLAYRISLLRFVPNKVCNNLSQDSWEVGIFSSYLT